MLQKSWRALDLVTKVMVVVAMVSLVLCIGINFVEIVRRYLFSKSIFWIQDGTLLLMMWFIFPGITRMTYDKQDILVDVFVHRMPKALQRGLELLTNLITALFSGLLTYEAYRHMLLNWTKKMNISGIPTRYFIVTVIFSFAIICVIYLLRVAENIQTLLRGEEEKK